MGIPTRKRYRKEESSSESDNEYVPYVPVKKRKELQLMKLGRLSQLKEEFGQRGNSSSENYITLHIHSIDPSNCHMALGYRTSQHNPYMNTYDIISPKNNTK
jgi:hypothetical protein